MSPVPDKAEAAAMDYYWETGWAGLSPRAVITDSVERMMDPALGPDRLVVAGPYEQEIKDCEVIIAGLKLEIRVLEAAKATLQARMARRS